MPRNLTIYKASAGSGKTYTLALRFILHVLGKRDPETGQYRLADPRSRFRHRDILAITFTNKATDEMKRRIVRELALLAESPLTAGGKSGYRDTLLQTFGPECTRAQLRDAARRALTDLLFDFHFFNVSTIDAFFQTILRAFAREAELAGNYELELEDERAVLVGVDEVIGSVANRDHLPPSDDDAAMRRLEGWMHRYMLHLIDNGAAFNMFNRGSRLRADLVKFIKSLLGEDYKVNSEAIDRYLAEPDRLAAFERELRAGMESCRREATGNADLAITLAGGEENLEKNLRAFLVGLAASDFSAKVTDAMRRRLDTDADNAAKFFNAAARKAQADNQESMTAARAAIEARCRMDMHRLLLDNIYNFGLFGEVMKQIKQFRVDNNLLLLSDTTSVLQSIIGNSSTPFVYERIGLHLHHFLIDEFQDTSALQWENIKPLILESLSSANDNLIIGDVKQSIYRFRNSDPDLLGSKVENDPELSSDIDTRQSTTNWRSSQTIVDFNNRLFLTLGAQLGVAEIYGSVRQQWRDGAPGGYVELNGIEAACADDFNAESMATTLHAIQRQLTSGAYRQSDIAVLVRNNEEGKRIIEYLLNEGRKQPGMTDIQILSADALRVSASPAVRLVIDELRRMNIASGNTDSRYTSPEEFNELVRDFDKLRADMAGDPYEALSAAVDKFCRAKACGNAAKSPRQAYEPSLYATVESVIASLPDDIRSRDAVFLTALLDMVVEFSSHGDTDLYSFLRWWDSTGERQSLSSPPALDAIRVMTIHKAKGLEFPCVHIPFINSPMMREDGVRWYSTATLTGYSAAALPPAIPLRSGSRLLGTPFAEQYVKRCAESVLDELNVLYVAFTRAVSELCVNFRVATARTPNPYHPGTAIATALGLPADSPVHFTAGAPTRKTDTGPIAGTDEPQPTDLAGLPHSRHTGIWSKTRIATQE